MRFTLSLKFIIGCSLTMLVALGATFYVINQRQERLIIQQAENEARAVFRQIVLMRKWIADHGGILVEKLPRLEPTPYVSDPEIIDTQGRRFVRETPAMVTKELAKYAREQGLFWFHITSLQLTNPENAPDSFERTALLAFEQKGLKEFIGLETINRHPYLRYIAPLYVEDVCLRCHDRQNYTVGDVRGAISVTLPMSETFAAATRNRRTMFTSMLLVVAVLSGAIIVMTHRLVITPIKKLSASMGQFSEGRRYDDAALPRTGDELEELALTFADMAERLTDYHLGLEDKIRAATMDLATANRQLQEANQQLEAMNERKSDFIARASHELRTPLTSIKGSIEYVSAKIATLAPAAAGGCRINEMLAFFELIGKNTDRLIRMVNIMLDLERIEMNAVAVLHRTDFDLAAVIREIVAAFSFIAKDKEVELASLLSAALPIRADEDRIRQVLTNLMGNALKFAPAHSTVTVRAAAEPDGVMVEMIDQGPGVPATEREKIFDKFYKLGNKEGSGLGLAICRGIIEAHGGAIGMTAPGHESGARFFFTIPQTPELSA